MTITASMVKELRDRTGAGMMECKKALVETGGDVEAAVEHMRKSGLAKADKKAGRVAAEGTIVVAKDESGLRAALVEVNCETDFVANGDDFREFASAVGDLVLDKRPAGVEELMTLSLGGAETVEERRRELIAKIGENINVRRFDLIDAETAMGSYLHGDRKKAALVALSGGDEEVARQLSMHVVATRPQCVSEDQVPEDVLTKEREILIEQAKQEGKPDNIVEKMVEGRLKKYLKEITLLGQPLVMDPDLSVEKFVADAGGTVTGFVRYEVGEGIEKKKDDFVEEVMAQVRGG